MEIMADKPPTISGILLLNAVVLNCTMYEIGCYMPRLNELILIYKRKRDYQ